MMIVTKPDVGWLVKLLVIVTYIHREYPELFNEEDEETLKIARQLIGSLDDEDTNS